MTGRNNLHRCQISLIAVGCLLCFFAQVFDARQMFLHDCKDSQLNKSSTPMRQIQCQHVLYLKWNCYFEKPDCRPRYFKHLLLLLIFVYVNIRLFIWLFSVLEITGHSCAAFGMLVRFTKEVRRLNFSQIVNVLDLHFQGQIFRIAQFWLFLRNGWIQRRMFFAHDGMPTTYIRPSNFVPVVDSLTFISQSQS